MIGTVRSCFGAPCLGLGKAVGGGGGVSLRAGCSGGCQFIENYRTSTRLSDTNVEAFYVIHPVITMFAKIRAVIRNKQTQVHPFAYDDIDRDSNQIRLLRILPPNATSEVQLEIFHANLDDNPTYKALSYTWGSPADPRHGINLNGYHFEVRENLWHALRRFQAGNVAPVIWIDAICINRSSDKERNHQVAKMKRIYEQATEVVVWLGPSYEDSDLAIKLVKELYDHRKSVSWVTQRFSMPDIKLALQALVHLLDRDYWWRIWIVQEVTVAQRIVFYCGDLFFDAESLRSVQQLFFSDA